MIEELLGATPNGWCYLPLGTVCQRGGGDIQTGPFGSQLHAADYVPVGIPSIMPQNIGDNRIVETGIARIAPADAQRLSRYRVQIGDIVYSRRGDVERRALIREREDGWLCGTGCLRVRVGHGVTDPAYAAFYLGHPAVREWIVRHAHGATMANLNTSILSACPFVLPPLAAQRAIACILSTLDDKIDLNRRMNETLETMARAIFNNWFLRHRDRFPRQRVSEFIESGILLIGDGYRAKNNELGMPGLPFIRAGELNNGFDTTRADILNERSIPAASQKLSQSGDVAFTSKGTIGRFARVTDQTPRFVYSPQVCFWRAVDVSRLRPSILYAWMVSEDLKDQIAAVAGQTDMAPYVSLRDQRAMTIPVFGPDQHHIAELIEPLLTLQSLNSMESRTLCEIRDLLLSKLMSGEIRTRDAEKAVAELV